MKALLLGLIPHPDATNAEVKRAVKIILADAGVDDDGLINGPFDVINFLTFLKKIGGRRMVLTANWLLDGMRRPKDQPGTIFGINGPVVRTADVMSDIANGIDEDMDPDDIVINPQTGGMMDGSGHYRREGGGTGIMTGEGPRQILDAQGRPTGAYTGAQLEAQNMINSLMGYEDDDY
jgi:hypothetical protein